jgi:hypothetical protein
VKNITKPKPGMNLPGHIILLLQMKKAPNDFIYL